MGEIKLVRHIVHPEIGPKPLQRTLYSIAGGETQLDFGYVDLRELHEAAEASKDENTTDNPEVLFNVTDRFLLTPLALADLATQVNAAIEHLKSTGTLVPLEEKDASSTT